MIYFDNSATTKPCDEVVRVINEDLTGDLWGNPGSLHKLGMKSSKAYDDALADCAKVLNCSAKNSYSHHVVPRALTRLYRVSSRLTPDWEKQLYLQELSISVPWRLWHNLRSRAMKCVTLMCFVTVNLILIN